MLGKWLYRLGVGVAGVVITAVATYLPTVDTSEFGLWAVTAGAVLVAVATLLGNLAKRIK